MFSVERKLWTEKKVGGWMMVWSACMVWGGRGVLFVELVVDGSEVDFCLHQEERFLDAFSHLYKRVCPSFRWSVGPSVRPSVRRSHSSWISEKWAKFEQNSIRNKKVCHLKDYSKTSTRAVRQRTHLLSELCSTCFSSIHLGATLNSINMVRNDDCQTNVKKGTMPNHWAASATTVLLS